MKLLNSRILDTGKMNEAIFIEVQYLTNLNRKYDMQNPEAKQRHLTHSDLRQAIRDIIRSLHGREFIAPIHIRDLDPIGYEVGFEHIQYRPTYISAELPDKEFLKFMEQELRRKSFLLADYFKTERVKTTFRENPFTLCCHTRE